MKADTSKPPKMLSTRAATNRLNQLVSNFVLERTLWLKRLMDPRRDIDQECGHPDTLTIEDYSELFRRGDVATRVVSVWPEESWSENPAVFETEGETETAFEKEWEALQKKLRIFHYMQRGDILSGVGRFGIILLGFGDGMTLDQPVPGIGEKGEQVGTPKTTLLYIRAFDESSVKVDSLETDITNPRFGQPKMYDVQFGDANSLIGTPAGAQTVASQKVHWTRIIHIADNRTSSEVFGTPRMEKVMNRILDLKKVAGGSGEMFWKGGFPGLSLETNPGDTEVEIDAEATKAQIEAYQNGLQRYLALVGMQAKSLSPQISDPTPTVDVQIRLIAMALGVPWRVFVGSEAAQLASEQDSRSWYRRLSRRREEYVTPFVITPFVERLVFAGVLTAPKEIIVKWPDLNTLSDQEKADVAERRTNALTKYVMAGADVLIPPFHFLTIILGMKDDEARAAIDEVGDQLMETDDPAAENPGDAPPASRNGNGRGEGRNGQPQRQPAAAN